MISMRDARHSSLSMIYPEDLRSRQHRLASPSTALRALTLGNVKVQTNNFCPQTDPEFSARFLQWLF